MSIKLLISACFVVGFIPECIEAQLGLFPSEERSEVCVPVQRGPVGPIGPKGSPGVDGLCRCNETELQSLREELHSQNRRLEALSQTLDDLMRGQESVWEGSSNGGDGITRAINVAKVESILKKELRKRNNCPVGLGDGRIADADITASSTYNATLNREMFAPHHARLDNRPTNQHIGAWLAKRTSPVRIISCSATASSFSESEVIVNCEKNCRSYSGYGSGVYGTGIYTSNSYICKAAIHDGRLTNKGGIVTFRRQPRRTYPASYQHNLHSNAYTAQRGSFMFVPNTRLEWIQVDLHTPTLLTGVITHGRPTYREEWITSFSISYGNSEDDLQTMTYENSTDVVFEANYDATSRVTNMFLNPITARFVRLVVLTWHNNIALRMEYLTC